MNICNENLISFHLFCFREPFVCRPVFSSSTRQSRASVSVRSRSARLMVLAEGLCSRLSPPPALPATAAPRRSVCLDVTLCVYACVISVLQGSVDNADSGRQQQAAGLEPPCGLPLSGTSCVGLQPRLPLLHPPLLGLLCTLLGGFSRVLLTLI